MTFYKDRRGTVFPGAGDIVALDRSLQSVNEPALPAVPRPPKRAHGREKDTSNKKILKGDITLPIPNRQLHDPPKEGLSRERNRETEVAAPSRITLTDELHTGNETDGSLLKAASKPKIDYQEFLMLEQAGSAIIAHDNTRERNFVAIKKLRATDEKSMLKICPFTSDHVVSIKEAFSDGKDIIIVYEQMDISLRRLTAILSNPLKEYQIAAICKEIVAGLSYIHDELRLYHGELNCGTVLLHLDGKVKIANIGESFVQNKSITETHRRSDIRCIGITMIELMEPVTYLRNSQGTELENPEIWSNGSGIKDFLRATQDKSLSELKNHDFLPKESLAMCIREYIFSAIRAVSNDWEIISLS